MLDKFVPDMYVQSIYRINYKKLASRGIRLIIFDLDNTIAPINIDLPSKEAIDLMLDIKDCSIKPILMTNSGKKRTNPFRNALEVDACASAKKPFSKNYKKIMKLYNIKPEEIACIGDQLLTDMWGANRLGMFSILTNPISKIDKKITYVNRFFEKIIYHILNKKDVLKKGNYYE